MVVMKTKFNSNDIIKALILNKTKRKFYFRYKYVCPNVYWGLGLIHECDLLVSSSLGIAHEIEIKISLSDLKKDLKKTHKHFSNKIKYLWFAIPYYLLDKGFNFIPKNAGIISIFFNTISNSFDYKFIRKPIVNKFARNLNSNELLKLCHLSSMRFWNLFNKLN